MGVNQTSELYKGFIFDGIDSKGFGVYITGSAVYNAPEREIEAIEIPGRNGAYMLDRGRFHNVTVTYPAGMFARDGEDFADGIRKLRNALASRRGYCRLIDEYNPLEYRMAVYRGGLEVEPTAINGDNKAAQFEIQFDCKPQRFRIDGDQPVKMTDGGVIDNPTLFEAKPLLHVWGYGEIGINDDTITVNDVQLGRTILAKEESIASSLAYYSGDVYEFAINPSALIQGDSIYASYWEGASVKGKGFTYAICALTEPGYSHVTGTLSTNSYTTIEFEYGDAHTHTIVNNNQAYQIYRASDGQTLSGVLKFRVSVDYDGDKTITVTPTYVGTTFSEGIQANGIVFRFGHGAVYGDSTMSSLGDPLFIDLDIGEAYKEENGVLISSNKGVMLPAELPIIKPGANTITFDNTVTELDIVPRWWEV